jgi:acyl-CoA dehydrogenase
MNAAKEKDKQKAVKEFDAALFGHIGFTLSNAIRSLVMALTLARFSYVPESGPTKRFYQHINRFSASFAFATDVAMLTMGGYLKKKESISARLGDVLSYLYLASMVLKHFDNQGRREDDLPLVEWACRTLLYQAQEQLHGVLRNFPVRFAGPFMRAIIFPRGRTYSAPSDTLASELVSVVMAPTETRERLTDGTYKTLEPTNALGLLQEVLVMAQSAEPLERKLRVDGVKTGKVTALDLPQQIDQAQSLGTLTQAEADLLRDYDKKVMNIIHVDDFDTSEMAAG